MTEKQKRGIIFRNGRAYSSAPSKAQNVLMNDGKNVEQAVGELKSTLEWKLFGNDTGVADPVTINVPFREVLVEIINTTDANRFSFIIPKKDFDNTAKVFVNGASWATTNVTYVSAGLDTSNRIVGTYRANGTPTTTNIIKKIYYR